ncbi:3-ketodihydrosphingosine reductase tsc10 [Paracoccidioides lutzii Pb01]|uniref:3-dehydrosphinganine reductase n=1 Tax=Paracoccidioides lutzii (strain ATCC MYA-826 / Pb01) TaxID=502779 RepID=C1GY70_PARBA|nr:3-ketodihydrosphingosine reductase tsc10 [Paracoccidioides lutzii Pb01]EEH41461.1 3-ketodihydrosphingosine reductase tsc10 [Paracoccidioides lutzii Pb01]
MPDLLSSITAAAFGLSLSTPQLITAVVLLIFSLYLLSMFDYFRSLNHFVVQGRMAVITGGSDGMGKSVAMELAKKGASVTVVGRDVTKLQAVFDAMNTIAPHVCGQKFHWIQADLIDPKESERVMAEVTEFNGGICPDIVWCCAGKCIPGFFVNTDPETLKSQMDTNYWTSAFTAHAILKLWLASGPPGQSPEKTPRRHLIFTSSTATFVPITGYGPYSPAKSAIRALADTLSQEIEVYNGARRNPSIPAPTADVRVHIVFPMGILSRGFVEEQKVKPSLTKYLEEADKPQTPDKVASIAIKRLERGHYAITTTMVGSIMKATSLGASPRNNIFRDTFNSWASNLIFLHVIPDLRDKAHRWGRVNGVPKEREENGITSVVPDAPC